MTAVEGGDVNSYWQNFRNGFSDSVDVFIWSGGAYHQSKEEESALHKRQRVETPTLRRHKSHVLEEIPT